MVLFTEMLRILPSVILTMIRGDVWVLSGLRHGYGHSWKQQ